MHRAIRTHTESSAGNHLTHHWNIVIFTHLRGGTCPFQKYGEPTYCLRVSNLHIYVRKIQSQPALLAVTYSQQAVFCVIICQAEKKKTIGSAAPSKIIKHLCSCSYFVLSKGHDPGVRRLNLARTCSPSQNILSLDAGVHRRLCTGVQLYCCMVMLFMCVQNTRNPSDVALT